MSNTTRIKICGLTSVDDARVASEQGADAIGLVFYAKSPRAIDVAMAQQIAKTVGPFVTLVGLFVNSSKTEVDNIVAQVPLQLLQFHGDETAEYCSSFQRPYIKALRVRSPVEATASALAEVMTQVQQECAQFHTAQGILLDAYSSKAYGGTGEQFNWQCIPEMLNELPLILAGGLNPDNVATAIEKTHPYAVDVSSGVESAPGVKDQQKIKQFIQQVNLK